LKQNGAIISIGIVSESEIDRLNILQASLLAMKKAVVAMAIQPDFLLVDGKFPVPMALAQQALVKGESKSASIAAASIAAKVERDTLMNDFHRQYPAYGFDRNKGYPTAEHRKAIQMHGPCAIHRQSFKCVREYISNNDQYEN
jgi:ribonuclease HII